MVEKNYITKLKFIFFAAKNKEVLEMLYWFYKEPLICIDICLEQSLNFLRIIVLVKTGSYRSEHLSFSVKIVTFCFDKFKGLLVEYNNNTL